MANKYINGVVLRSGDTATINAAAVPELVGVENYQYELTPEDMGIEWVNYDLSDTTEITGPNATRLTTYNKIDTRGFSQVIVTAPEGYRYYLAPYDSATDTARYISTYGNGWDVGPHTRNYSLMFPYYRIVLAKTSGNIAPADASNFTITFIKELPDYSEKELSLMLESYIDKKIFPYTFGGLLLDPTQYTAYENWVSGSKTLADANEWTSKTFRCVPGDSIEVVAAEQTSRAILSVYGNDGVLTYAAPGVGINTLTKISYTFQEGEKYFRVTTRRTLYDYSDVRYISQFDNNAYIPNYAETEYKRVLGQLQEKMILGNPIVFGFNTDQHNNAETEPRMGVIYGLRTMKKLSNAIPFDLNCLGGDMASYSSTQVLQILNDVNYINEQLEGSSCPVVPIVGNHDTIDNNSNVTNAEVYNVFFKRAVNAGYFDYYETNACNAYRDSVMHKVRFVFVDSIPRTGYTLADGNAFLETVFNTLPSGYKVILLSHRALHPNLDTSIFGDTTNFGWHIDRNADKIIACISGHSHRDGSETLNGVLYICTTTSGLGGLDSTDTRRDELGTANETAYDVFVVDQVNKKIYAIRYGYGENREFTYT